MSSESPRAGFTFDIGALLRTFTPDPGPPGTVTLVLPYAVSPHFLMEHDLGQEFIDAYCATFCSNWEWWKQDVASGTYRLRFPEESRCMTMRDCRSLLQEGEHIAPLGLVQLALLSMKMARMYNGLHGRMVRCAEPTEEGHHIGCKWSPGLEPQMMMGNISDTDTEDVYVAVFQKIA